MWLWNKKNKMHCTFLEEGVAGLQFKKKGVFPLEAAWISTKKDNLRTDDFLQHALCSDVPIFSRNCLCMMPPQTFYTTYPTQSYTFQLNVWAR